MKVRVSRDGDEAYRTLADWYMVLNKRDQHEKALLASYKTADENQLRQRIYAKMSPWQRWQASWYVSFHLKGTFKMQRISARSL